MRRTCIDHKELAHSISIGPPKIILSSAKHGQLDRLDCCRHKCNVSWFNPRSLLEKIVTRSLEGGGGVSIGPPFLLFDTIHPIDLKSGTYSKLHLYFQLSETTWCLISFHGNNSQINDVTGGRHLGFSNFQILFTFSLLYLRLTGKQRLAVEIHEIGRIHCEVASF